MKKQIILSLSVISSIYALTIPTTMTTVANNVTTMLKICSITSTQDASAQAAYQADPTKCFNAYDIPFTSSTGAIVSPVSLGTKTAGKDFIFKIEKKPTCAVSNLTYSLVDKTTGEVIPNTTHTVTNPLDEQAVEFNVPNSYKDVEVKFEYNKVTPATTPTEVTCPTNPKFVHNTTEITDPSVIFAVPNQYRYCYTFNYSLVSNTTGLNQYSWQFQKTACPTNSNDINIVTTAGVQNDNKVYGVVDTYKCYEYIPTTTTAVEYSTDDFAIKPDKFDITLKKSPVKVGAVEPMDLSVVNANNDVTTNYSNSSINLIVTFDPSSIQAKYGFNINNGVLSKNYLSFLNPENNVDMNVTDENFANVDKDDTQQSCRNITGTSNQINVIGGSKYWAGTGTNEPENNPTKNNVNSDIKQNVKKDIHFQKMGW